ncbi:N-acylglucosamine 2-epimerase [Pedobacter sp. HMF7647]|uniref:N-acylglucosamine 2-epimerase n=1 Tax=Hufsiella arboris TaxID=2695275 RepID=A0A7K1YDE2_9SPHI|nr:AGE family epimerase/isomerase [Hufsiella arboris]MXV52109.1 N-acylglucosamine 2-epimerase [Hufsiella arboris]
MNKRFISVCILQALFFCVLNSNAQTQKIAIAHEMLKSSRVELLDKWYPLSIDTAYGGFKSAFTYNFRLAPNQEKMIVTQARHTWSNAKASLMFPGVAYYKYGAKHGFEFLKNVMWDKTYGGFYTLTDREGNVKNTDSFAAKEAYGNSFGLYALAAYYESSGDTAALNMAKQVFMWLEKHSHDPVKKGYFQHMMRDGTPVKRNASYPSTSDRGYKDQNTSIHLLEAFTELYTVWSDSLVRERLKELLFLVRDKITTPKGYLTLFFQPDWTPVSFRDSSEASILKHHYLDHVSFGHDVETAYLMLEASHALGFENDTLTMRIAKKMVDHALDNGWDNKVGGFYDEGYYFKDKIGMTIIRDSKNWWAQAEGLNSLLLMSDYYPNDKQQYYSKFLKLWSYVQTYLIDHENGDWYQGGLDKEPQYKLALKGQIWKGTYHNFRALMNCVLRLDPDKQTPTVPSSVVIKQMNDQTLLTWRSSSDNKQVIGYNIYENGRKIGFTPLNKFDVPNYSTTPKRIFTVQAVDLQRNESAMSQKVALK